MPCSLFLFDIHLTPNMGQKHPPWVYQMVEWVAVSHSEIFSFLEQETLNSILAFPEYLMTPLANLEPCDAQISKWNTSSVKSLSWCPILALAGCIIRTTVGYSFGTSAGITCGATVIRLFLINVRLHSSYISIILQGVESWKTIRLTFLESWLRDSRVSLHTRVLAFSKTIGVKLFTYSVAWNKMFFIALCAHAISKIHFSKVLYWW